MVLILLVKVQSWADASGFSHPGLIPIGIPMLCTQQSDLVEIRQTAIESGCDVVDFPIEGQQTKNYDEFMQMTAQIQPEDMKYTGIAFSILFDDCLECGMGYLRAE
ncbi:MAG: DUF2000 family protein [Anaerocolumna sp.]